MSQSVPDAVRDYLAASVSNDPAAIAACFTADGEVQDEKRTHVGPAAIRAWAKEVREKYRFTLEVRDVAGKDDDIAVIAEVTGTFPGSPIVLRYAFHLTDGKIARLRIGLPTA